jgi:hypothetical protein
MHRSFGFVMVILVCFYCSECTRYVDPPMPEAQRLLMAKPWNLAYTDSISIDSLNSVHYYHLPARECEKMEPVSFATNFNYYIQLVCDQPIPSTLNGNWQYGADSILGYGLKTDTGLNISLNIAKLKLITSDTLKLAQGSSFASPDIHYQFYVDKTYSH